MPREMTRKPVGRRTVKSIRKAVAQLGFGCCGYEDADEVLSMDKRIKQTANISVE